MSDSKHTPGPWRVESAIGENNELCFHEILAAGEACPLASTWAVPHIGNANLIASAPDLLAGLHGIDGYIRHARHCHSADGGRKCDCGMPEALKGARAAIAKAEGRPQ